MKGTDKIIAHINADAQKECAAIIAEADEKCAEIRRSYEQKAKEEYAAAIRAGVKQEQERLERLDRIARMEGKKTVLAVKQELVENCFAKAKDMLLSLPEEEYSEFLLSHILRAKPAEGTRLVLNAEDREKYGRMLAEKVNAELGPVLSLSSDCGGFCGGFILRSADTEYNCTAELLLSQCRSSMSAEAAQALFE